MTGNHLLHADRKVFAINAKIWDGAEALVEVVYTTTSYIPWLTCMAIKH